MSQAGQISGEGAVLPVTVPIDFVTDDGTATADNNILNVFGGDGIETSGVDNTITISQKFEPNRILTLVDDFLCQNGTGSAAPGQLMWNHLNNITTLSTTSNAHPGIMRFQNDVHCGISLSESGTRHNFIVGGGEIAINFVVDLITLSTGAAQYVNYIGMTDDITGAAIVNGIYFSYTDNVNSGNWVLNCTTGGVTSSVNSAIAATTGYHNYQIVINAAATSVSFFIDGVSAGAAVVANIPTAVISPYFLSSRVSGALPLTEIDLFYMKQVLTTAR
jgi:hypothetical protein